MSSAIKIRTLILLTAFSTCSCDRLGMLATEARVKEQVEKIENSPSAKNIRLYLNMRVDGETAYYHMSQGGRLFAQFPLLFKSIYSDIQTDRERRHFKTLKLHGADVFQYHLDMKPDNFDEIYRSASWLNEK